MLTGRLAALSLQTAYGSAKAGVTRPSRYPGNVVKIGNGPATVRDVTKVTTNVHEPLEKSGKADRGSQVRRPARRYHHNRGGSNHASRSGQWVNRLTSSIFASKSPNGIVFCVIVTM